MNPTDYPAAFVATYGEPLRAIAHAIRMCAETERGRERLDEILGAAEVTRNYPAWKWAHKQVSIVHEQRLRGKV